MLVFRARRRVSPALRNEPTPSERAMIRRIVEARRDIEAHVNRNLTEFTDKIAHQTPDSVIRLMPIAPLADLQQYVQDELTVEVLDAGSRVQLPAIRKAVIGYSFDRDRPESAAWAASEAARLIREITQDQADVIRWLIADGQAFGRSPYDTARLIRDTVGLTQQQAEWVQNFQDRAFTERVQAGQSTAVAQAGAEAAAARYHDQIHRYRSETIARTEIMRANSEGRQEAWAQGIKGGWIGPDAQKEWLAESDACDICSPINGMRVGILDEFPAGEPPAHPNCRCDVLFVEDMPESNEQNELAALSPSDVSGMSPFMALDPGDSRAATFFAETYEGQSAVKQVLANRAAGLPDFAGIDLDGGAFGFMQNAQFYVNGAQAYSRANLQADILASADLIARDLAGAGFTTSPLYRGMRVDNPADLFRVGDSIDLRMSSATPNAQIANLYTRPDRYRQGGAAVLMEIRPGFSASNIDRGRMTGNQSGSQEHLLNGSGRVIQVRQEGDRWIVVVESA